MKVGVDVDEKERRRRTETEKVGVHVEGRQWTKTTDGVNVDGRDRRQTETMKDRVDVDEEIDDDRRRR